MAHAYPRCRLLALSAVLFLTTPNGMAAMTDGADTSADFYFAGGGFYQFVDSGRNVKEPSGGWQITPGMRLSGNWWLEAHASSATLERGTGMGTDFYQRMIGANLHYAFGDRNQLTPYVFAGVGASHNDVTPDTNDGWAGYATAGAGVVRRLWDFELLRWRAEASVIQDDFMQGHLDTRLTLGLELALQRQRATPEKEIIVKEVVREVVKEVFVTAAAPVSGNPDLDADGVINEKDLCPDTPSGAKVDGNGCVIEQTLTFRDVTFEFNSSRLTMNGKRLLDSVVAFLRSDPSISATIEGHTDSRGSDAYNLKLSEARAAAVKAYLLEEGIAARRLTSAGLGESRPMASNETDAGREANRRVEFVLRKSN